MLYNTKKYVCICCGKESSHPDLLSGHSFGTDDLDFRPAFPYGSLVGSWIKWCPFCKYSAEDISAPIADADLCLDTIKSERYQKTDGLQLPSESTRAYYRAALLAEARGDDYAEIQFLQHAIWCCDDFTKYSDEAAALRRITIPKIKCYQNNHVDDRTVYEPMLLILIDFYRRLSEFEEALHLCTTEKCTLEPEYVAAANYQRDLANARDNRRYDFASAFEVYPIDFTEIEKEDEYKHELLKLGISGFEVKNKQDEGQVNNLPFSNLSEAFQHEAEPAFEAELETFVSNMPYSRRTMYAITEAIRAHPNYDFLYAHLLGTMNEMLTAEERMAFCDFYMYHGSDKG